MVDEIASVPELAGLTTRHSDDYSITFIDLWAAVLDVITFYQERYANEAFLRTATQQASLVRLARLLDYRLRPGVAATTELAFTLDAGKTVPVPIGLRVQSIPAQNQQPQTYQVLEAIEADARFNQLRIFPHPKDVNPLAQNSAGAILDRMQGPGFLGALSANDPVVLFNDGGTAPVEQKKIATVVTQDDYVRLTWTKPVSSDQWDAHTMAFKYRRTFRIFGYNASPSFMQPVKSTKVPGGILWSQIDTDFSNAGGTKLNLDTRYSDLATGTQLLVVTTTPPLPPPPFPEPPSLGNFLGGNVFNISKFVSASQLPFAAQPLAKSAIVSSSLISLLPDITVPPIGLGGAARGVKTQLVTVTEISQAAATAQGKGQTAGDPGAMSDTVTQVSITPAIDAIDDIRETMIFELVGSQITFWGYDYESTITNAALYLPGKLVQDDAGLGIEVGRIIQQNAFVPGVVIHPQDLADGRKLLLTDGQGVAAKASVQGSLSIDLVTSDAGTFGHLVVPVQAGAIALDTGSALLLGNVAQASAGDSVSNEVVGSGDASQKLQSFMLQKQPLTYIPSAAPGGVSSTLQLRVNQVLWKEVAELYQQALSAQVFSTRIDESGKVVIQFGDGAYGSVLPTGQANVTATYRTGVNGQIGANSLTTLLDRIAGLNSVTNPLPSDGGADAETMDTVRDKAPRTVRTFDRAVSLRDFEDLVTASGEVAKASATWTWDGYAPAVYLTVAGQNGTTFSDLNAVGATLANARDPNQRVLLGNFGAVPVLLSAKLWLDPSYSQRDVLATARQAITAALSFERLTLGESLHLSHIYAVLQAVSGVVAAEVTQLGFKQPAGVTDFHAYQAGRGVTLLSNGSAAPVQDFLRVFPARPDPNAAGAVLPAELAAIENPLQDIQITAQS
jgi:uncharacterized phage protein gp47/JayE